MIVKSLPAFHLKNEVNVDDNDESNKDKELWRYLGVQETFDDELELFRFLGIPEVYDTESEVLAGFRGEVLDEAT